IDDIRARKSDIPVTVYYTDQPRNDFNALALNVHATKEEVGMNLLLNGNFESKSRFWKVDAPISWVSGEGVDGSGALRMSASYKEHSKYIYEVKAQECVQFKDTESFFVDAQFRYDSLPKNGLGHRLEIIWYEDDHCSRGGQWGMYIDPKITPGWQTLSKASVRPSLNARSVNVVVKQNQNTSVVKLSALEELWVIFLDFIGWGYTPTLVSGYWDNISLTPTHIPSKSTAIAVRSSSHNLALGENYLKNGSFDKGVEHWRISTDSEWAQEEGYLKSGSLYTTLVSGSGPIGTGVSRQCINFGTESAFEMGVRFKRGERSTQEGGGRLRTTWFEEENCRGRSSISSRHADPEKIAGWQELKVEKLVPPKGALSVKVSMIQSVMDKGEFSVYWDDVYFRALSN
ncbi:MAG: hypothetical protein KUG73_07485, partial [Pseudomonadales bacterium]|nr:hypothetical protein [Pseudomonadales bacterium]